MHAASCLIAQLVRYPLSLGGPVCLFSVCVCVFISYFSFGPVVLLDSWSTPGFPLSRLVSVGVSMCFGMGSVDSRTSCVSLGHARLIYRFRAFDVHASKSGLSLFRVRLPLCPLARSSAN